MAATKYIEGIGRRKTSIARVRITEDSKKTYSINGKTLAEYFPVEDLQTNVLAPLKVTELDGKFSVSVKVLGGGVSAQSDAIRHGLSRALTKHDAELRGALKREGYLKRDPRAKERKKPGLKKARKAAQWSKR